MKIEETWLTVPINEVLKFWADAYQGGEGKTIRGREYFVDPVKNVMLFKLTTTDEK